MKRGLLHYSRLVAFYGYAPGMGCCASMVVDSPISTTNGITTFNQQAAKDKSPFHSYRDAQGLCYGEAYVLAGR
jgi:hypothetical protein